MSESKFLHSKLKSEDERYQRHTQMSCLDIRCAIRADLVLHNHTSSLSFDVVFTGLHLFVCKTQSPTMGYLLNRLNQANVLRRNSEQYLPLKLCYRRFCVLTTFSLEVISKYQFLKNLTVDSSVTFDLSFKKRARRVLSFGVSSTRDLPLRVAALCF